MFGLFKKKENKSFLVDLVVDMHSHLLPGIDDGAKELADSLALVKKLKELGYKKLITTPHIMQDSYPNTKEIIEQKLTLLQEALKKENIAIEIEAAAEYYLDEFFLEKLHQPQELLVINKSYLLFETSYMARPLNLQELIYEIKVAGLKPIFAHPERYRYIKELEEYYALKDMGVYFQLNLNSLAGHYGKDAYKKALFLMQNGLIDFLGSDAHHLRHLQSLEQIGQDSKLYKQIIAKNTILNQTLL